MRDTASGQIFLSYRRDDTQHVAGRLFDRLAERFGDVNVFMDVDSIEPGLDFDEAVERAVGECDVLLALIGTRWLGGTDEHGQRRLDDPDDLMCLEIKAALDRDIRVIPVLIDGAAAPRRDDLPKILAPRNAIRLDHETFRTDIGRLIDVLDRVVQATPHTATHVVAEPPRSSVPSLTPLQEDPPTAAPPAVPAPTAAPTTAADSTLTRESHTSTAGSTADTPSTPEPLLAPTHLNATAERVRELDKDTPTRYRQVLGELGHVYDLITRRLLRGKVVPVLGAGVNLCERPPQVSWEYGRYLPSAQELAAELAKYIDNVTIDSYDLTRVMQYCMWWRGMAWDRFTINSTISSTRTIHPHFFTASSPGWLAAPVRRRTSVNACSS